ncbi:hypothetical protein V5799_006025 [Amblyomma americanum]|uniref:Uncharacterized protein n=1 Tax=Amblyomma americanum TaxID=6943 RepID=A0AAQ4DXL4_AMBAM
MLVKGERCCGTSDTSRKVVVTAKEAAGGHRSAQESAAKELFDHLFEVAKLLSLPGNSWAVHCVDKDGVRDIVFSQLVVKHAPKMATVYSPRTVLIKGDMTVTVLLMGVSVKSVADVSTKVSSVDDLEELLRAVDALRVCKGGPNSKVYPKAEPECAYLDSLSAWRHDQCPLVLTEPGEACRLCHALSDTLRINMSRAIARQEAGIQPKAIRLPRMTREDALQLRKTNYALRRSNKRFEQRIKTVRRELEELRQEIEVVQCQTRKQLADIQND